MEETTSRERIVKMVLGIVATVLTYASGWLVNPLCAKFGWDGMMVRPVVRAVVGVLFIVLLGGAGWLRPCWKAIRNTFKISWPLVRINLILGPLMFVATLVMLLTGDGIDPGVFLRLLTTTVLCIFVGINEEAMFRGLMFGGLVAGLGTKKNGALWAAVISSLAFGFLHVAFDLRPDNVLGMVQGLMKTLECAMFGLVLCTAAIQERNYTGTMLAHGFFDWILMIDGALAGSGPTATYVSSDPQQAIAGIVVFTVLTLLYFPCTRRCVLQLMSLEAPQFGPFIEEEPSMMQETSQDTLSAGTVDAADAQRGRYAMNREVTLQQDPTMQVPPAPAGLSMQANPASVGPSAQEEAVASAGEYAPAEPVPSEPVTAAPPRKLHRLLDRPLLSAFLIPLIIIFVFNILVIPLAFLRINLHSTVGSVTTAVLQVLASFAAVAIFRFVLFRDEFDGMARWSTLGMLLVLPGLFFVVANLFDFDKLTFAWNEGHINSLPVCLALAAAPGVSEEVMFRNLSISNWMRVRCERRDVVIVALVTALLFGGVHSMNVLAGAAPGSTAFQMFYAACMGTFFAAVFLRSGSMWPTMIMHTLIDFTSFLFMDMNNMGLIIEEVVIGPSFIYVLICSVVLLAWGIFLLRPSKQDEVVKLWNAKWHRG